MTAADHDTGALRELAQAFRVATDFWDWQGGHIPWTNYLGWLGLAFLFQVYFQKAPIYKENRLAPYVYLVQAVFFISIWTLL